MFISFLFVVDGVDTTCSCTVYHDAHTKPGRGPGRARARITRRADYNDPAMCYLKLSLLCRALPCLASRPWRLAPSVHESTCVIAGGDAGAPAQSLRYARALPRDST